MIGRQSDPGFATRAIHAGQDPDPLTGAVVTPIHLASTFAQEAVGKHKGYDYGRTRNPTRVSLETTIALARGGESRLRLRERHGCRRRRPTPAEAGRPPGDPRRRLRRHLPARLHPLRAARASAFSPVELQSPDALAAAWRDETRLVWLETPSNPKLNIIDIAAVAAVAHAHGARCIVDNTFATPYLQQPLELGADAVVHSSTKYLGGHSDVVGGFVATNDVDLAAHLGFVQNSAGAVPSPFDCYLVQRGLKTLAVRLERQCANAATVAAHLLGPRGGRGRLLSGTCPPPGAPARSSSDARLRRDGVLHAARG